VKKHDGSTSPTLVGSAEIVKLDLHYLQEAYLALYMRDIFAADRTRAVHIRFAFRQVRGARVSTRGRSSTFNQ
jgi:hypothetical protein